MLIRQTAFDDQSPYVAYAEQHFAESGTDGDEIYSMDDPDVPFDPEGFRERTLARWSQGLEKTNWRRTFVAFDVDRIVGHSELVGPQHWTERHRIELSLGVLRSHRRQGLGTRLMEAALLWSREQAEIDWVDLGVFTSNSVAIALYESLGFTEVGRTPDRYRVRSTSLDEIAMTIDVRVP